MKIPLLPEVLAPTGDEDVVIHSDGRAKRTKLLRIVDSIMGAGAATAARDKAQTWADAAENVAVEPGKFSARHWAAKALAQFNASVGQALAAATSATAALASKNAAGLSEANSVAAMNTALALVNGLGPNKTYTSYAALVAAFGAAANQSTADVYPDSTHANRATRYYKDTAVSPGAWIFHRYMDVSPTYYCDSDYGSDLNDGLTPDTPKKSIAALQALAGTQSGVTFALARGSHWYGEYPNFSANPWSKVIAYGQGIRPVIDGATAKFTGVWTRHPTYPNVWSQDIVLLQATQGAGPGDANRWHIGLWDEPPAIVSMGASDPQTRILNGWLKRVLNGDPSPDPATFDIDRPQTTTIAVASQAALLEIVNTFPNSFTVFKTAGGYEPNDGTPATAFTVHVHLADGSDPNTNGRTLRINEQVGLATLGRGMDVHDVIFARNGGKDMIGGFQDLSVLPRAPSGKDVFSGNFYNCSFWLAGAHGPVCGGMGGYDCDYIGHYMRDAYKSGAGAFHDFRSVGGVNKGRGYGWVRSRAKRFGYMFYCHGNGDGSDGQNRISYVDTAFADDGRAVAVGGTTSQGYWLRGGVARSIDSIGSNGFPESTYEDCRFLLRGSGANSIGNGAPTLATTWPTPNAGTARFINSLVISLGTTLQLPLGPLANLAPAQFVTLILERSTIWGNIQAETNNQYRQLHITMDRHSYLGVFNSLGAGNTSTELYPTGTITARGPDAGGNFGAIIECLRTTPETIRAAFPGIEPGVATGMRTQVWRRTVQQADLVYVVRQAFNATGFVDNGDGTATVTTGFNYGTANVTRGIRIAGANAGATDYYGTVRQVIDNNSLRVSPVPTGSMAGGKACAFGFYRPYPFRDPVAAYISADGTKLNVANADGMVVGQVLRVSHPVPGQPGFGVRTIAAIAGTVITLDKPCPWLQRQNKLVYRDIATPTTGTGRTLPGVTISWGFPIQMRILADTSFVLPKYAVTPNEGGPDIGASQQVAVLNGTFTGAGLVDVTLNSAGTAAAYANMDYEAGYWAQGFGLAPGDTLTLTCEIDVAEDRLAFATPPELGGYAPTPGCLLTQRRIGYRPSL